jgi:hypothetical protein
LLPKGFRFTAHAFGMFAAEEAPVVEEELQQVQGIRAQVRRAQRCGVALA